MKTFVGDRAVNQARTVTEHLSIFLSLSDNFDNRLGKSLGHTRVSNWIQPIEPPGDKPVCGDVRAMHDRIPKQGLYDVAIDFRDLLTKRHSRRSPEAIDRGSHLRIHPMHSKRRELRHHVTLRDIC